MDLMVKEALKNYIVNYSGSFVGFLTVVADILDDLGKDWEKVGKKEWADIFYSSACQIMAVTEDLQKIRDEYETSQINS